MPRKRPKSLETDVYRKLWQLNTALAELSAVESNMDHMIADDIEPEPAPEPMEG